MSVPAPGVSTSSAPYASIIVLRSGLMPSGITIDARVALDRGDRRARDPGVARRALDDRHAGPQVAALLGPGQHVRVDPVLHRARSGRTTRPSRGPRRRRARRAASRTSGVRPIASSSVGSSRRCASQSIVTSSSSARPVGAGARRSRAAARRRRAASDGQHRPIRGRSTRRIRNAGPDTPSAAITRAVRLAHRAPPPRSDPPPAPPSSARTRARRISASCARSSAGSMIVPGVTRSSGAARQPLPLRVVA